MKNKDFIVNGAKIGYFDDGMIVITDPEVIKENQPAKTEKLTFGEAIELLKHFNYLSRKSWGDNITKRIYLVENSEVSKENLRGQAAKAFKNKYTGCPAFIRSHIDMTEDNRIYCGWTPTVDDVLAEDWYVNNPT